MRLKVVMAWVVGAFLWVANPLDGDCLPVVGWIDDAVVCWIAYRQVRKELKPKVIDV